MTAIHRHGTVARLAAVTFAALCCLSAAPVCGDAPSCLSPRAASYNEDITSAKGPLTPVGAVSNGVVHEVLTSDFAFSPQHITVAPGDTVRWVWVSGFHTATSGIGCGASGTVFNGWVTPALPTFDWVVPADFEPGTIPYVCIPHCGMAMNGTVTIEAATTECPQDLNDDDAVDVLDLLILLDAWGPCNGCPEDFNGDGLVDVLDLLQLLDAWGPCLR